VRIVVELRVRTDDLRSMFGGDLSRTQRRGGIRHRVELAGGVGACLRPTGRLPTGVLEEVLDVAVACAAMAVAPLELRHEGEDGGLQATDLLLRAGDQLGESLHIDRSGIDVEPGVSARLQCGERIALQGGCFDRSGTHVR
jgi:hypothetical protein